MEFVPGELRHWWMAASQALMANVAWCWGVCCAVGDGCLSEWTVLKPGSCWQRWERFLDASRWSMDVKWNTAVSHVGPFLTQTSRRWLGCFTTRVHKMERVSYAPRKGATENPHAAISYCATESDSGNSFFPSTLITKDSAKTGCVISGGTKWLIEIINAAKWQEKNSETIPSSFTLFCLFVCLFFVCNAKLNTFRHWALLFWGVLLCSS